jgi:protein gp37
MTDVAPGVLFKDFAIFLTPALAFAIVFNVRMSSFDHARTTFFFFGISVPFCENRPCITPNHFSNAPHRERNRTFMNLPVEWQPMTGCSYASPGCTNCKAMNLAPTELRAEFERDGLVKDSKTGPVWTGAVRFSEARLALPTQTKARTEFSVCPHSDLFHENVPDSWIDKVFDEMERCSWHAFQVLTKRAARLESYVSNRYAAKQPPPHIAFGTSCERQIEADDRIPHLLRTPAAIRFVTFYPLLGPIDLRNYLAAGRIRFVLAGEEPERPASREWFNSIDAQCKAAAVPFVKTDLLVGQTERQ